MKRILPSEEFFGAIFCTYFEFLKQALVCGKFFHKAEFIVAQNTREGVRQKFFKGTIAGKFKYSDKKISEQILCIVKYNERSKKLFVAFKSKSPHDFINTLKTLKQDSLSLLASYFYELAWGLMELIVPVFSPCDFDSAYFMVPRIKNPDFYSAVQKNHFEIPVLFVDVLCILYNIYLQRKKRTCFLLVSARDIMFLRRVKSFRKEDEKRIAQAIELLNSLNLIRAVKTKRYEWKFCIIQSALCDDYLVPSVLFSLNPKIHAFERHLGNILCASAQHLKFEIKLNTIAQCLKLHSKVLKPCKIRDRIESALERLCSAGVIYRWQYKKIDENVLCGENWLMKYKKLKIVFCIVPDKKVIKTGQHIKLPRSS